MVATAVIAQFLAAHPKAQAALGRAKVDVALAEERPCAEVDSSAPAAEVAVVSPDGARLAIFASWHEGGRGLAKAHVIVVDDRGAAVFAPTSSPGCEWDDQLQWSSDSQRVLATHRDDNGVRTALVVGKRMVLDVVAREDEAVSPDLRLVAWVKFGEEGKDVLRVNGEQVFAGKRVSKIAWDGDATLTFCDSDVRYRARIGKAVHVKRDGACSD
jgi:hypothetical protein